MLSYETIGTNIRVEYKNQWISMLGCNPIVFQRIIVIGALMLYFSVVAYRIIEKWV